MLCNTDAPCSMSRLSNGRIVISGSLQALHGIFPGKSKDELKIPLESAGYNVERAVAQILNDDDDDSDNCLEVSCLGLTNEQNICGAGK